MDCANFIICNTHPLSRQPQTANLKPSLKNAYQQPDRKTTLTGIRKSEKIKTDHPAGFIQGRIYKLRLCFLFNQKRELQQIIFQNRQICVLSRDRVFS